MKFVQVCLALYNIILHLFNMLSLNILEELCLYIIVSNKKIFKKIPVEIHIVEHCNLNCKGCAHFSSIAKESYLDIESFEESCKKLSKIKKHIYTFKILGG